jgi:hypothetical protein
MRIFKTKAFNRIVTKDVEISDEALKIAVKEMNSGLFEASLGANVYKKRVALDGRGKSNGARTILCFKLGEKAIFMHAFAKNEQDNISPKEKEYLKELADDLLKLSDDQIKIALKKGELLEVK